MIYSVTSPLLDACVLGVLTGGDAYGYALTQEIRQWLTISESTLYPVLRRLQQEGALKVYDQPYQGRNRRYYGLTTVGNAMLEGYRQEWKTYRDGIEALLFSEKGVENHDQ